MRIAYFLLLFAGVAGIQKINTQQHITSPDHTLQMPDTAKQRVLKLTIDSIFQSQVSNQFIPGAVILIKQQDQVIQKKAYGNAALWNQDHQLLAAPKKMTLHHLFDLASLTKVIGTTTAIMYLADRHQLSVDDRVSKYIRSFDTPEKRTITIRHLLTHTSGILEWYPMYYRSDNKQATFKLISELPLFDSIGKQRRYSDLGFTILGQITEVVSGLPLDRFVKEKIFVPLGMKHTMYNPLKNGNSLPIAPTSFGNPYEKRMVYDSALGFRRKEIDPNSWNGWRQYQLAGEVNDGNAWYANGGVSGAAGIFSTIDDIQRLVDMLQHKGRINGEQFISETTISEFLTKDRFNNGLGWMMDPSISLLKNGPAGSYGHTGFTGTSIAVIPACNISVILLVNRQHTGLSAKGEYYNLSPVRAAVFKAVMDYCR
ncbi:MAG TPA: serine hydrolase [Sediminibacterium sp.]|nr:serine hydrolase [Sediminibacterium sp.]